jgi:adenosine deaminase
MLDRSCRWPLLAETTPEPNREEAVFQAGSAEVTPGPLIDLHCHLEGAIDPSLSFEILRGSGHPAAHHRDEFVQRFTSFRREYNHFSAALHLLEQCLMNREAVIDAVADIVESAAAQGVKIFEPTFAPGEFKQGATSGSLRPYTEAVIEGIERGSRGRDIAVGLRMAIVSRHLTSQFRRIYGDIGQHAEEYRAQIVGVDLCGLDRMTEALRGQWGMPAVQWDLDWTRDFSIRVRELGLHLSAHAGEFLSAEAMNWVLDMGVERIGHGIQSAFDPDILDRLLDSGVTLEVCPISNYQTGAVACGQPHPLHALLSRGVGVTINTDDPGVQGSSWSGEYRFAQKELGLTNAEIRQCLRNSWRASFLPDAEKHCYEQLFNNNCQGSGTGVAQTPGFVALRVPHR